jgi:hypothetical protein
MISSQTSNDLFNKIRSKFGNIQIGNNLGEVTANPGDAVFFDFEFTEDADTFGRVSISIADGETIKVFYNQGLVKKIDEESRSEWYAFLKELKDFAVTHQLGFDVRDITKDGLNQQDFKNIADTNQTVNIDDMSEELSRITKLAGLSEGLTGTSKSSFENLDKTRLIIRHSKAVDENIPGDRTRNINSLYIENQDGERFKYPVIHLAGARAMARHVANGGVPHDDFGKHIVGVSEQIAQLNSFSRYAANKDQLNDSAGDIIEKAKLKLETMRKYIKGLSKQKNYEAVKETFQPTEPTELDDATKASLREKFTLKHMDDRVESALPLLHNIMQEYDKPEDEIADPEMDAPLSKKDVEIPTPVDAAPLVQQYLADPENKLILRKDNTADAMLKRTKFTTKNGMLSSILSDIAARMLTKTPEQDRVANFASSIANDIGREGTPFFEPTKDYIANKKIAFQLAKRYVDDYKKMQQDPEYAGQVRQDPAEFGNPKKDRQGRAKEDVSAQFESWADNITEQKPYVSMYRGDDGKMVYDVLDKDGESAYMSSDYDTATAYLRKNFDRLAGRKTDDHFDTAMTQTAMDDVNENPEANQEMSMDFEFTGDDGETAMGTLYYKVINGKVDPNSLRGESEYEGNAKVDDEFATIMVQPGGGDHESAMIAAQDDYDYEAKRMQSKFGEGNEFALAVQKAKAAGMKPGDKFEVGGKEYTLKDAIEQAGLQLETFFGEDESVAEDTGGKEGFDYPEGGKYGYKAERGSGTGPMGITQVNVTLHNRETNEVMHIKDMSYLELEKGEEQETLAMIWDENKDLIQKESVAEAKPDFLDLDKDGNKTEPMKSAAKDAKKESTELDSIRKLAGI